MKPKRELFLLCYVLICLNAVISAEKQSTSNYWIRLDTLHCIISNEHEDEIEVQITVDGRTENKIYGQHFKQGDRHDMKYYGSSSFITLSFNDSVHLKFTEKDGDTWLTQFFDPDEDLGTITINETNIDSQFVKIKPKKLEDCDGCEYHLTWETLSDFVGDKPEKLVSRYNQYKARHPKVDSKLDDKSRLLLRSSKSAYWDIKKHMSQRDRIRKTLSSMKEAGKKFRETDNVNERNKAADNIEKVIDFLGLLKIMKNADMGEFGSIVVMGYGTPFNAGTAEWGTAYGFAFSTQPESQRKEDRVRHLFSTSFAVGLTAGDIQRIAIGWNRNPPKDVPGWTYDYSIPSDAELPNGGITMSYDAVSPYELPLKLFKLALPDLQEVTYSIGPLPGGVSAGITFTAGFRSRFY